MTEAFCMKEKAKLEMNGVSEVRMRNGRRALQGTCPSCGTKLFRILGKADQAGPLVVFTPPRNELSTIQATF
jgi:RNase P subunit RPR2